MAYGLNILPFISAEWYFILQVIHLIFKELNSIYSPNFPMFYQLAVPHVVQSDGNLPVNIDGGGSKLRCSCRDGVIKHTKILVSPDCPVLRGPVTLEVSERALWAALTEAIKSGLVWLLRVS